MYQPMLYLHWKQIRLALLPFVLAAFGLPLVAVAGLGAPPGASESPLNPYVLVGAGNVWLPAFPILAAAIGVVLALSAWNWDHRLGHVYALSLPLTRTEYALLKMGAGATLAFLPAVALWLGAHVAAAAVALPDGLHAYPNQLAIRFFLAILVAYSALFAMAAGTVKTSLWVVSGALAFLVLGTLTTDLLLFRSYLLTDGSLIATVLEWLIQARGPFELFTGNWSLIDV
jgi:hypothetical protein